MHVPRSVTFSALLLVACDRPWPTEPYFTAAPTCAAPAPLLGGEDRIYQAIVDEYFVILVPGTDVMVEGARLRAKYRFRITEFFSIAPIFIASMSAEVVAEVRCEPTVQGVQFVNVTPQPPP